MMPAKPATRTANARPRRRRNCGFVAAADGEQLYYRDIGSGPALLFVHGWAMNGDFWERQVAELAHAGHRCIVYDQRGCGRSSPALEGYDLDSLADDLAVLIDALELERIILVAHSMATTVAARFVSRHGGSRVAGAVLVSGTAPGIFLDPESRTEPLKTQIRAMMADRPAFVRAMAEPFFSPETVSAETVAWGCGLVLQAPLHSAIQYTRTNIEADVRRDLTAFEMPTLLIHGGSDASSPLEQSAAIAHQLIPGSELRVYEGASHGLPLTRARVLNRDIAAFVASVARHLDHPRRNDHSRAAADSRR